MIKYIGGGVYEIPAYLFFSTLSLSDKRCETSEGYVYYNEALGKAIYSLEKLDVGVLESAQWDKQVEDFTVHLLELLSTIRKCALQMGWDRYYMLYVLTRLILALDV